MNFHPPSEDDETGNENDNNESDDNNETDDNSETDDKNETADNGDYQEYSRADHVKIGTVVLTSFLWAIFA